MSLWVAGAPRCVYVCMSVLSQLYCMWVWGYIDIVPSSSWLWLSLSGLLFDVELSVSSVWCPVCDAEATPSGAR